MKDRVLRLAYPVYMTIIAIVVAGILQSEGKTPKFVNDLKLERLPVIVDTDIGYYMDDTWAFAYLSSIKELLDIRLVVTATDNTRGRANVAAKQLSRMGLGDTPIGYGLATPPKDFVGYLWPWASEYNISYYEGPVIEDGVSALLNEMRRGTSEKPILLLELAPSTNVAEAIVRDPEACRNVHLVAMGGSFFMGYDNSTQQIAEYNINYNTTAAQIILSAQWASTPIFIPLDAGNYFDIRQGAYQSILRAAKHETPIPSTLLDMYNVYWKKAKNMPIPFSDTPQTGSGPSYDLLTSWSGVHMFLSGSVAPLNLRKVCMGISNNGFTNILDTSHCQSTHVRGKGEAFVALNWTNGWQSGTKLVTDSIAELLIA